MNGIPKTHRRLYIPANHTWYVTPDISRRVALHAQRISEQNPLLCPNNPTPYFKESCGTIFVGCLQQLQHYEFGFMPDLERCNPSQFVPCGFPFFDTVRFDYTQKGDPIRLPKDLAFCIGVEEVHPNYPLQFSVQNIITHSERSVFCKVLRDYPHFNNLSNIFKTGFLWYERIQLESELHRKLVTRLRSNKRIISDAQLRSHPQVFNLESWNE